MELRNECTYRRSMIVVKAFKRILTIPLEIKLFVSEQGLSYGNRRKLPNNSPVIFVFLKSNETGRCQSEYIYCFGLGMELQKFRNIFIMSHPF